MSRRNVTTALVGLALTAVTMTHASDIQTITHGREVSLEDHLVSGKYVLFDFYADWCGPCRALEPRLADLAGRHSDRLALRKVDIINWDSPVTRQHGVTSIPHMVLYGPDGSRLAAGDAHSVLRRLESGLGDGGGFPVTNDGGPSFVPLLAIAAIFAVTVGLVARRRRPPQTDARAGPGRTLPPVDTAADPGDPAIWFALVQGSLEGPFTGRQLGELVRRGVLERLSTVRRRGDASWTTIEDAVD